MLMTDNCNDDMRQAVNDPEAHFKSPGELTQHGRLTRADKIAALEQWAFAVCSRVDAVNEGMTSRPDGAYARDVDLLRQIQTLLEALRRQANEASDT